MGMTVNTNMMAINANNALNKNNSTVAKNLEKLSTGLKINRAGDDASGLAISKKMEAQIKALDTANANAKDGQNLIKTAEGYMDSIHSMLNRMVELAEKSANGTYETVEGGVDAEKYGGAGTDRQALQDEMDQLCSEIDRVADTANFNNLKIMNGNLQSKYTDDDVKDLKMLDTSTAALKAGDKATSKTDYYNAKGEKVSLDQDDVATEALYAANKLTDATAVGANAGQVLLKNVGSGGDPKYAVSNKEGSAGGLKLQIGETSKNSDKLNVTVRSFYTQDLFKGVGEAVKNESACAIKTLKDNGGTAKDATTINISNQDTASSAAESIRDVIDKVSSQRAKLGAQENKLDYTMDNLNTASENITNAKAGITDTDMAKTMMKYTQGNVLTQAAQAMLAQANQSTQGVLSLLQ